jgi:hypothetical protein
MLMNGDTVEDGVDTGRDCEDCWSVDMSMRWMRGTEGIRDTLMDDCRSIVTSPDIGMLQVDKVYMYMIRIFQ